MRTAARSAAAKRGPAIDVIGCARRAPGWKRGQRSGTHSGNEAARSQQRAQRRLGRRAPPRRDAEGDEESPELHPEPCRLQPRWTAYARRKARATLRVPRPNLQYAISGCHHQQCQWWLTSSRQRRTEQDGGCLCAAYIKRLGKRRQRMAHCAPFSVVTCLS